jgi:hypothetical protein
MKIRTTPPELCSRCGEANKEYYFTAAKGYLTACKDCLNKSSREYYYSNSKKMYMACKRRRAQKYNEKISDVKEDIIGNISQDKVITPLKNVLYPLQRHYKNNKIYDELRNFVCTVVEVEP